MDILTKNVLRNDRYYLGYILSNYRFIESEQEKVIAKWDTYADCFVYWRIDGNKKIKSKVKILKDVDNRVDFGFTPVKEVIPREEFIVD